MLLTVIGVSHTVVSWGFAAENGHAILSMDRVRPGMKGYGLTVFHGTKIEAFEVEVLSVMRDFGPGRGVIWITCPEPRMQHLGPVQGMSGSPVYLWGEDEPHELGVGGKLIGAYALGFGASKDCIVGVQPIEQMLDVATRANPPVAAREVGSEVSRSGGEGDSVESDISGSVMATGGPAGVVSGVASGGAPGPPGSQQGPGSPGVLGVREVVQMAKRNGLSRIDRWRAESMLRLIDRFGGKDHTDGKGAARDTDLNVDEHWPDPTGSGRQVRPLSVPMRLRSPRVAEWLRPLLEPMGIVPVAAGPNPGEMGKDGIAGNPPFWIDPDLIEIRPGSVLSVPLAFGDLDMSAIGTATEVLPDGRVLAFGHSLFGQGPISAPMAGGYVHLIMPSLFSSFKLGGSGAIRGAIVQDEGSALVGTPGGRFETSPVEVTVKMADQPDATYRYEAVRHKNLTPLIATVLVMESLTALSDLPIENTLRLRGQMRFTGDRVVEIDSTSADSNAFKVLVELYPIVSAMILNPHEPMMLESMTMTAEVQPRLRLGSIVSAQLDRREVDPGDTIGITLQVQGYGQETVKHRVQIDVPPGVPEGEYELVLCDAGTYADLLFETHPHLMYAGDVDDLHAVIQRLLNVSSEDLHMVLQLPQPGLAIGRQELPRLPSSRRALLETQANTLATPYREWIERTVPMGMVLQGGVQFTVTVR